MQRKKRKKKMMNSLMLSLMTKENKYQTLMTKLLTIVIVSKGYVIYFIFPFTIKDYEGRLREEELP